MPALSEWQGTSINRKWQTIFRHNKELIQLTKRLPKCLEAPCFNSCIPSSAVTITKSQWRPQHSGRTRLGTTSQKTWDGNFLLSCEFLDDSLQQEKEEKPFLLESCSLPDYPRVVNALVSFMLMPVHLTPCIL